MRLGEDHRVWGSTARAVGGKRREEGKSLLRSKTVGLVFAESKWLVMRFLMRKRIGLDTHHVTFTFKEGLDSIVELLYGNRHDAAEIGELAGNTKELARYSRDPSVRIKKRREGRGGSERVRIGQSGEWMGRLTRVCLEGRWAEGKVDVGRLAQRGGASSSNYSVVHYSSV